jgi:membrane associated rhomboid family serine protease
MGFSDRPYYGDQSEPTLRGRMSGVTVTMWLIGINVVIFLLDSVLGGSRRAAAAAPYELGYFSIDKAAYGLQLWRWFTYQFLHGDLFHILFNMLMLYYFGPWIERALGARRFLAFYLLCGCSGAVIFTGLTFVPGLLGVDETSHLIGASGSIFGILVACALLFPRQELMFWGAIRMTMRTMALVFLGLAALGVIVGSRNAGGEAAHLGGALLGFVLIKNSRWLNIFDRMSMPNISPGQIAEKRRRSSFNQKIKKQQALEAEVDRILDKVHHEGLASLTKKEKRILQEATDHQRLD